MSYTDPKHTHTTSMREALADAAITEALACSFTGEEVSPVTRRIVSSFKHGVGIKRDRKRRRKKR